MSTLLITTKPSTAKIVATYTPESEEITVSGAGSLLIDELANGTVVNYTITADQCVTDTGTKTIEDGENAVNVTLSYIGSVQADTWVPGNGATFPTHAASLGKGGWKEYKTTQERDAIPDAHLELGMAVYVTDEEKLYILSGINTGTTPYTKTWTEFESGISGLGRYLSLWNCKTGLPETNPPESPYVYMSGDYFVVNSSYSQSEIGPESCVVYQTYPEEPFGSLTVDMETFKEYEEPTADVSHIFAYNNISIDYSRAHGTEKLGIVNQGKFDEIYALRQSSAEAYLEERKNQYSGYGEVLSIEDKVNTRWFEYSDSLFVELNFNFTFKWYPDPEDPDYHEPYEQTMNHTYMTYKLDNSTQYSLEYKKELVRRFYEEECGIGIVGELYYGMYPWEEEVQAIIDDESVELRWTIDGNELPSGVTFADYGITKSGKADQKGDAFQLDYKTEKYNYKPNGSSYITGVASTTKENEEVSVNDVYIYDGSEWRLQYNSQKIVSFATLSGSPYDNAALTEALNNKSQVVWKFILGDEVEE